MKFRHEWKHEINYTDLLTLRSRLTAVMTADKNAVGGVYEIRSLYLDNLQDKALQEKINGVNFREKFRVRYYNGNTSFVLLEKKSKINGLCSKKQAELSTEEAHAIATCDLNILGKSEKPLILELCMKMRTQGLQPKTIVDYTREAFVYTPGNVRVTLDYNLRTGLGNTDFLNPNCITIPAGDAPIILEIKWDEFLPSIIRDVIQLDGRHSSAFSKYAACRIYG